jgi:hypothetical protein
MILNAPREANILNEERLENTNNEKIISLETKSSAYWSDYKRKKIINVNQS